MFSRFKTKRNAYAVYLGMEFATSLLFSMIFTVSMVYQVTTVGLNPLQLVLVGTTLEVAAFVFEVPTGVVADTLSRRTSIIMGMLIMGAGFVVEGSLPVFAAILLAQVLWGLGYTLTSGATEAWIADEVGEEQAGKAFLRAGQIGAIGALAGIGLGTFLGNFAVNLPIVLGGVLLIGVGVALIVVMPETGFKPAPRGERTTFQSMAHTFKSGMRLVRGKPALINILTIGLVFGLYSEGLDRLWTPHFLQSITLPIIGDLTPVTWLGVIRAGGMLLGLGLTEVARRRVDTHRHGGVARAVLSLNLAMISMSSQVDAFGQIVGGPIVGGIGSAFGLRAALTSSAAILAAALPLLARVIKLDRHAETIGREAAADVVVSEEGVAIE